MCQGEGANVALESDKEDDDKDARKVSFSIYNVSFKLSAHFLLDLSDFRLKNCENFSKRQ